MRWVCQTFLLTAGLGLATATIQGADKDPFQPTSPCGEFGTAVHFEDTPTEAAKAAKKAEKLVLILHVSGHFEDPKLT